MTTWTAADLPSFAGRTVIVTGANSGLGEVTARELARVGAKVILAVRNTDKGPGGHHGAQHPFTVIVRDAEHPITKGMPAQWLHANDELYDFLRGPADNMTVLATAFATKDKGGSGRHEPMLFTVTYGQGRIFHTPMGHADYSQECVGFIAAFQRGTEWAATGQVTLPLPTDFPSADKVSQRKFNE